MRPGRAIPRQQRTAFACSKDCRSLADRLKPTGLPIFSSPATCSPQKQRQMLNTSPWLPPLA